MRKNVSVLSGEDQNLLAVAPKFPQSAALYEWRGTVNISEQEFQDDMMDKLQELAIEAIMPLAREMNVSSETMSIKRILQCSAV